MPSAAGFNATGFSRWINGAAGRAFRLAAGATCLVLGLVLGDQGWGIAVIAWSVFPLSAGLLDICWVSAALGGPLSGRRIRAGQVVPAAA